MDFLCMRFVLFNDGTMFSEAICRGTRAACEAVEDDEPMETMFPAETINAIRFAVKSEPAWQEFFAECDRANPGDVTWVGSA